MARSMSNKDGMAGTKPPGMKYFQVASVPYKTGKLSAGAAIKAAKSAADLAKMGYKIVPIPGKKKK